MGDVGRSDESRQAQEEGREIYDKYSPMGTHACFVPIEVMEALPYPTPALHGGTEEGKAELNAIRCPSGSRRNTRTCNRHVIFLPLIVLNISAGRGSRGDRGAGCFHQDLCEILPALHQ
jgi:hypothetical protein